MVCQNCGKEMIEVGELTDKEYEDLQYINSIYVTTNQALNPDTIKKMEFEDGKVFEYFCSAFDAKAKAAFLEYIFWRDVRNRLNIHDKEIILERVAEPRKLFIHPEE